MRRATGTASKQQSTSIEDRLGNGIMRLERELSGAKDAALRPMGLTVPQYSALFVIADTPGINGAELARRCLVTPQTMTIVLGNLTVKGLIERRSRPGQGRAMETNITAAGKRLLGRADRKALEVEELLNGQLSKSDQQSLRKLLEKCRSAFTTAAAQAELREIAKEPAAPARKATVKKAPAVAKRPAKKAVTKRASVRAKNA